MIDKILIVDDEKSICEILEFNLANEGFETASAYSAEDALDMLDSSYSLIVLDVMMNGMSGYKMAEKLRGSQNHIPIIFLTARDSENDILTGFSVGADDYISKPFSITQLIARVKAILKRAGHAANAGRADQFMAGDLTIDLKTKEVSAGSHVFPLTRTEFEILYLLASNPSKLFSREEIIEQIWRDAPYITERTVDVHITRMRKKMGDNASCISNRTGYGYRFNPTGK